MEDTSEEYKVSSFKAVLLGALASGVNGPTWTAFKDAFLMTGVCLAAMMGLTFAGGDPLLTLLVLFLVVIAVAIFVILSGFMASGLISVVHQMKELDLAPDELNQKQKFK